MRIAFVEVRDKTDLLLEVARRFSDHEVFWLVQNHMFSRQEMLNPTELPYPSAQHLKDHNRTLSQLTKDEQGFLKRVAADDRFQLYFGGNTRHYPYYFVLINEWFKTVRPDVIIGEVGNFHSHMVSLLASAHEVPFLNPMTCRYPVGRFSFYLHDRLTTIGGAPQTITDSALRDEAMAIASSQKVPSYMTVQRSWPKTLKYKSKLLYEWARGERYATQNPIQSLKSSALRKVQLRKLYRLSTKIIPASPQPTVLFPMQMQPELNLDIWGRDFRDQEGIIQEISRSEVQTVVKLNPKPFFEITSTLVRFARLRPDISFLPLSTPMSEAEPKADLVVTVTGTIAIERLLRKRPVLVLNQDYADWLGIPSAADLGISLDSIDAESINQITKSQSDLSPISLLSRLADQSFPGVIYEPLLAPEVTQDQNVTYIENAVRSLLTN